MLQEAARGRERELDLLAYQVAEIEAVAPARRRDRGAHRRGGPALARRAPDGAGSPRPSTRSRARTAIADAAASLASVLEAAAELDPSATEVADRARGLAAEISELARDVRSYAEVAPARPGTAGGGPGADRGPEAAAPEVRADRCGRAPVPHGGVRAARTLAGADDRIAELEAEPRRRIAPSRDRAATVIRGPHDEPSRPLRRPRSGQSSRSSGCPAPSSRSGSIRRRARPRGRRAGRAVVLGLARAAGPRRSRRPHPAASSPG